MIAAAMERLAREDSAAVAVSCRGVETTYSELHHRSTRLAGGLQALAGQRVEVPVEDFIRQLVCLLVLDQLRAQPRKGPASGIRSARRKSGRTRDRRPPPVRTAT